MLEKLKGLVRALVDKKSAPRSRQPAIPPVDLNKPLTNPALSAALTAFLRERTPDHAVKMKVELRKAVFLVPMLTDELHTNEQTAEGVVTLRKNSQLKIISAVDDGGQSLLALFTDWEAIRRFIQQPVSTLVMPAKDAWSFALQSYEGAIVNPASTSLPLSKDALQKLAQPE